MGKSEEPLLSRFTAFGREKASKVFTLKEAKLKTGTVYNEWIEQ